MVNLRLALVAIAAVLMVGCGSGPATTDAGTAKNLDTKFVAPKKEGGAGAQVGVATAQKGPGADEADSRIGTKVK